MTVGGFGNNKENWKKVTNVIMRIKEHREQAGMTQRQLGARMGVDSSFVTEWETEVVLPKARQLPLLAQVLGCSISDLFVPLEEVS